MSTSALSSVVTHTVSLPETSTAPTVRPALTLGLVPTLEPYLGPAPDCEPPFDEEVRPPRTQSLPAARTAVRQRPAHRPAGQPPLGHPPLGHPPLGQASLGLVHTSTPSRISPTEVHDPNVPGWSCEPDSGITRTAAQDLPPSREASHMLARAVIEVITGYRQLSQLRIHCAPQVFAGIGQQIRVGGPPPRLLSVRASEPADGVVEASAVFRRRNRAAAMAFRLEGIDGRWRITALQIG